MPARGGNPGRIPSRSSPWQMAQFFEYDCAPGSLFAVPCCFACDEVCASAAGRAVAPTADWGATPSANPQPAIATPHQARRYRSTLLKLLEGIPEPARAGYSRILDQL